MQRSGLVTEDNDECRTLLRMLPTHLECTVVEARNGLEAIEKSRQHASRFHHNGFAHAATRRPGSYKSLGGEFTNQRHTHCDKHGA
jgi:CheY-like chemotaxis protein